MYRDREISKRQLTWTRPGIIPAPACENNPFLPGGSSGNATVLRLMKGRSSITQGNGVSPTPYRAWRITVSSKPGYRYGAYSYRCIKPSRFMYTHDEMRGYRSLGDFEFLLGIQRFGNNVSNTYCRPRTNSNLETRVRNAMLKAIANSDVDFGETLGGLFQTMHMVGRKHALAVKALSLLLPSRKFKTKAQQRRAAREYTRNMTKASPVFATRRSLAGRTAGDRFNAARKAAANGYLEFAFGWAPLINDIRHGRESIMKSLMRDNSGHYKITRSGTVKENANVHDYANIKYGGEIEYGTQQGCAYRIHDSYLHGLNSLGLANPLNTAWQMLPFSFVVDWFLSIGDWLEGLKAWHGVTYLGGYKTSWVRGAFTATDVVFASSYSHLTNGDYPTHTVASFAMERTVVLFPPLPGLRFKFPLKPFQWITGLALAQKLR